MNEQQALAKMSPPGKVKPTKWLGGIIQVHIIRACDRACLACTQGSNLRGKPYSISLDTFEKCVISMKGYHGVVGIFGGNPAIHPKFPEICEILEHHIPFRNRGLWCNHPMAHGKLMSRIFNPHVSNLNVHQSQEAYDAFKRDWPESRPFGLENDSRHSPVLGSMLDLVNLHGKENTEENRWDLISNCDINREWSALVGEFRGQPRAWFCEIAGSQSINQQHLPNYPDTGIDPTVTYDGKKWWQQSMEFFADQARYHCHRCLVPLRGYGQLANSEIEHEQTTHTYLPIFQPKRQRTVDVITTTDELGKPLQLSTDYIGNGKCS